MGHHNHHLVLFLRLARSAIHKLLTSRPSSSATSLDPCLLSHSPNTALLLLNLEGKEEEEGRRGEGGGDDSPLVSFSCLSCSLSRSKRRKRAPTRFPSGKRLKPILSSHLLPQQHHLDEEEEARQEQLCGGGQDTYRYGDANNKSLEQSDYTSLSQEEFNDAVQDFITTFRRQITHQQSP